MIDEEVEVLVQRERERWGRSLVVVVVEVVKKEHWFIENNSNK